MHQGRHQIWYQYHHSYIPFHPMLMNYYIIHMSDYDSSTSYNSLKKVGFILSK